MVNGELPFVVADLPSLQQMAASMNLRLGDDTTRSSMSGPA